MTRIEVRRGLRMPQRVESILRGLPEWFGIEEALVGYVEQAATLPSLAAVVDDEVVGVSVVKNHSDYAAEVALLAVDRRWHRRGVGRRLMEAVECDLVEQGVEFVEVKTLGPSRPSPEYERTRRFYEAMGYRPLEELEGLWPGNPCLIMVKHLGGPQASDGRRPDNVVASDVSSRHKA